MDIKNNILNIFQNHLLVSLMFIFIVIAVYTDCKAMKIYNKFNLSFLITRILIIFIPIFNVSISFNNVISSIFAFAALLIPAMALMFKMGGDIKFVAILTSVFTIDVTVIFLAISCISMLIYSFIKKLITKQKDIRKVRVQFAPFFMVAFISLYLLSFII